MNINKGGRPKIKSERLKRNHKVTLYFNDKEIELFENYKKKNRLRNIKLSTFCRDIMLDTIKNKSIKIVNKYHPEALLELNKIGINLNQIAKKVNSLNKLSASDTQNLVTILEKIEAIYLKELEK